MSEIITVQSSAMSVPVKTVALPKPRVAIHVRLGTNDDIPFIDGLMKKHSKQLAFLPTNALEGKVALQHVLIAETTNGERAGYLIGNDRYKSRDELGVIYQICVAPEFRRMLVGAHLLKARFETSAYGCKLYCCWCAQDLTASNEFYESMGFAPIAFRAGSEKRSRVHIFWQKRIRAGDTTTPWWFPSETRGGLMDAARIALPIPPGLSWRDEMPRIVGSEQCAVSGDQAEMGSDEETESCKPNRTSQIGSRKSDDRPLGGMWFGKPQAVKPEKPKRVKKLAPDLAAKARELRDRWSEQQDQFVALSAGKYDVARTLETGSIVEPAPRLLSAA